MKIINKSHSPYILQNPQYSQPQDYIEVQEPQLRNRKLYTMNRGNSKYERTPGHQEIDEREAQLFSSMSQTELKDHMIQNINAEDYNQQEEADFIIEQLHK